MISGGIGINVFGLQGAEPALPFGGLGASGMGCHSGFEGFLTYTHNKSVFECADDSAIMAALNIAHEYLQLQGGAKPARSSAAGVDDDLVRRKMDEFEGILEKAVADQEKLF